MNSTIVLAAQQRQTLLDLYRHAKEPQLSRRAHILLLLADGYTWATIAAVLFVSTSTIARWQQRFRDAGLDGLPGHGCRLRSRWFTYASVRVVRSVTQITTRSWSFVTIRQNCA